MTNYMINEMSRSIKPMLRNMAVAFTVFGCSVSTANVDSINYNWPSANNWEGGAFSIPPWFAEDLQYSGKEVLRFHPDYYNSNATGFWTYSFALIVDQLGDVTTDEIVQETKQYFKGLGETLGEHKKPYIAIDAIKVSATSDWVSYKQGEWKAQQYKLTAIDSWETGKPIDLNVNVSTWLCKNSQHRAIVYAITPHDWNSSIWQQLRREAGAFNC